MTKPKSKSRGPGKSDTELQAAVRIARTILQHTTLEGILSAITTELRRVIDFDRSSVALMTTERDALVLRNICHPDERAVAVGDGRRIPRDDSSVIGWVANHRVPVLRSDIKSDERFLEVVREEQLRCDMIVPLIARGELFGTLNVGSRTKNTLRAKDLAMLVSCAEIVSAAIEHVLLLEEARDLGERYATLQRSASDMILLVERHTGRIVENNDKCTRTLGFDADELRKRSFFDLFPREDQYQARRDFINILSEKSKGFVDRRLMARDGSIRFVDISASLVDFKSESFIQLLLHDVSQRRMLEHQIILQNKKLQSANRTLRDVDQMKTEFLSNISHELRTPLSIIIAYADTLRDSDLSDEDRLQFLDVIADNGEHLLQLINDLLDLSRLELSGAMMSLTLCHVHDAIRSVWPRVRSAAADKHVKLEFLPGDGIPPVHIDVRRIRQVLSCLIHNAIKFTSVEGRVRVITRNHAEGVRVEVSDTGAGIPEEQIPHVFETFRQGDGSATRRFGGLGIGLAMVRHIIEMHGGTIRVDSEEGRGSTFSFVLPVDELARRLQTVDASPEDANAKARRTLEGQGSAKANRGGDGVEEHDALQRDPVGTPHNDTS